MNCETEELYSQRQEQEQRHHPLAYSPGFGSLPDDVIANALSFLFSGEKTDWKEAVRDLASIKCLNKAISQRLTSSILPKMKCSVNFLHFADPSRTFYTLLLLGKSQIKLSALHINCGYHDFDLLATLLSMHFDATGIQCLTLELPARPVPSRYIAPTADHVLLPSSKTHVPGVGQYIDIPMEFTRFALSDLLSLSLFQSLTTLKTSLMLNPIVWNPGLDVLYQLPMLRSLDLKLTFVPRPRTVSCASLQTVSNVIHQMMNLEELTLRACGHDSERCAVLFMNSFALRSSTLRIAIFHQLPSRFFLRECNCPRLELFTCRSSSDGNGVRPRDPAIEENRYFPAGEEYIVGSHSFFGMNVPNECVVSTRYIA